MNSAKKITHCHWCGSSEHEGTAKDGSGFWCADCDGFTYFQQDRNDRLADMLNSLYTGFDGPDMIITYDQCPEIEALYPWADVQQINRIYSCKRQGE